METSKYNWFRMGFKRNNEAVKFIEPCLLVKGYPCRITAVGQGETHWVSDGVEDAWEEYDTYVDVFIPFFDSAKMSKELQAETKAKKYSLDECLEKGFEQYLIKLGTTSDYEAWNETDIKEAEFLEKKEVVFWSHDCWETGIVWKQLAPLFNGKYPEHVFNAMKPFLKYHSEQEEEEGEWKGWAATNMTKIKEALSKIGWSVKG